MNTRSEAVWSPSRSVLPALVAACLVAHAPAFGDDAEKDRAVNLKLEEKMPLHFKNAPLEDILKFIKSASQGPGDDRGITFVVDHEELKKAGVSVSGRVSIDSDGVPLKTSIKELLKPLKLGYEVREGAVRVTSESALKGVDGDKKGGAANGKEGK